MTAAALVHSSPTLPVLREAAAGCRACDLWKLGTQTVFGEGNPDARIMMAGEQPGDKEDQMGRPFVGPAGGILDKALAAAGIDRNTVYVTNIVKHFKWQLRGKRRIHKKPSTLETRACRPWLEAEIRAVKPEIIVLLGATAAQALLGPEFRVSRHRGEWLHTSFAAGVMATVHPSSILRAPDAASRREEMLHFVEDLRKAGERLTKLKAA